MTGALALFLLLFGSHRGGMDCCAACGSYRGVDSWGVAGLTFLAGESIRPSRALADLFPSGHEHDWRLSYSNKTGGLFAPGGWTCGGRYRSAFGNAFEENGAFRDWILAEIRAGRASVEEVRTMIGLCDRPFRDTDEERLVRPKAREWMVAHAPGFPIHGMEWPPGAAAEAGLRGARSEAEGGK